MADFKNEQEYQDYRSRSYNDIPEQHELESLSDIKLAEKQSEITSGKSALIIIQNEWRRREKLEQHKLNKEIIKQQHEFNLKISRSQNKMVLIAALIAALFGIVGVFIGARLQLSSTEAQNIQTVAPQQGQLNTTEKKPTKALCQKKLGQETEEKEKISLSPSSTHQ